MTSQALRRRDEASADAIPGAHGPVLLLTPSRGLGGGIERYVETVQSAFDAWGVAHRRLDLLHRGPGSHRALLREATVALAESAEATQVIVAHRALLPVAALLARIRPVRGISVICHGIDVWGKRSSLRWQLESRLMRRPGVRIVAVSSFTAGSLFPVGQAAILPPGLSRSWFEELVSAGAAGRGPRASLELMTAFRLGAWRDKGLPQLTAAVADLGRTDIRLTVCGTGEPPADLLAHVSAVPWCTLRPRLTDRELAAEFAGTDLFVLASRTRPGRRASGEGFGLVLLEAQVAGTAVVGPAHGGSPDAYLDGVSGTAPRDESAAALAQVLDGLLRQPGMLSEMGERGAQWARARFAPDKYAALVIDRLL
ncbi:MAG: phosphatidyl-myo-inositol dimannoside synthase [Trebonia sp.]|nr:phosphatidyl-myo-inositol dimannoside synthase [Trebonia sp.]